MFQPSRTEKEMKQLEFVFEFDFEFEPKVSINQKKKKKKRNQTMSQVPKISICSFCFILKSLIKFIWTHITLSTHCFFYAHTTFFVRILVYLSLCLYYIFLCVKWTHITIITVFRNVCPFYMKKRNVHTNTSSENLNSKKPTHIQIRNMDSLKKRA